MERATFSNCSDQYGAVGPRLPLLIHVSDLCQRAGGLEESKAHAKGIQQGELTPNPQIESRSLLHYIYVASETVLKGHFGHLNRAAIGPSC